VTERRIHQRVEISHPVLYFANNHNRRQIGATTELSVEGTRIETPFGLAIGDRVEMSIAIHPQVINCIGHVVHTQGPDGEWEKAGVRFDYLREHDRLYLREYVEFLIEHDTRVPS
jgi:hypothetical protein